MRPQCWLSQFWTISTVQSSFYPEDKSFLTFTFITKAKSKIKHKRLREAELQNINQCDFSFWICHSVAYLATWKSAEIIAGVKRSKGESRLLCLVPTIKKMAVPQAHMRAFASTSRNNFIEIKEEKLTQLTSPFTCAPKQEDNLNKQDKEWETGRLQTSLNTMGNAGSKWTS